LSEIEQSAAELLTI